MEGDDQGAIVPLLGNEYANGGGNDRYNNFVLIGEGAYGTVFRANDSHTNDAVALKVMAFQYEDDGIPMATMREISLLRRLDHDQNEHVVRLLDVCIGRNRLRLELVLVFEYCQQDLGSYIKSARDENRNIPSEQIKSIMRQMLMGSDFLHTHQVVHRDLKPQNILLHEGVVKIADFGLARIHELHQKLTPVVVTLWYRAPEVLLNNSYASPIDVWSLGCIFGELFNARALIASRGGDTQQLKEIINLIGMPPRTDWTDTPIDYDWFVQACVQSHLVNRYGENVDLDSQLATDAVNNEIDRIQQDEAEFVGKKDLNVAIPRMYRRTQAVNLFWRMMTFNPLHRISCKDSLDHPYFTEVDPVEDILRNGFEAVSNDVGIHQFRIIDTVQRTPTSS